MVLTGCTWPADTGRAAPRNSKDKARAAIRVRFIVTIHSFGKIRFYSGLRFFI